VAGIDAPLRFEGIEAAAAVITQPIAQRGLSHAGTPGTGDLVIGSNDAFDRLLTRSGGEFFGQQLSN
jgi:hypothetical protein